FEQRGLRCWATDGNEADDLAATLARKVTEPGHQAPIESTHKGYSQLLSPGMRIRDYIQKRRLDAPFIEKQIGERPRQLPDNWG
ncbi:flap endonuclease Xni, partial [Salmonella enterica subsp. enterica serovar Oslo]|nr:flap endonuclease Xni [Salmonella enterica subsp. enterica serovar Oslo]